MQEGLAAQSLDDLNKRGDVSWRGNYGECHALCRLINSAHHAAFRAIRAARPVTRLWAGRRGRLGPPGGTRVMDLDFPGVLGLAAGFDKDGLERLLGEMGLGD